MTIVVAGEALIDLAPRGELLLPLPGGSPYNVAIGLARLGRAGEYLGRVSTDGFGQRLLQRLRDEGGGTRYVVATDEPTTLAVIHLDAQARASYGFYLQGTSTTGLTGDDIDRLPGLPDAAPLHVSFGAITLDDPAGEVLAGLIRTGAGHRVRTLDPNIRANVIADMPAYAPRMDRLVATCDLVKVSDEDLELLHPGVDPLDTAARWAGSGPAWIVVTRGPDGAVTFDASGGRRHISGIEVEVVDTVGAGDAFTSGLLAALDRAGHLSSPDTLAAISGDGLDAAVRDAIRVAAITCTRAGSDPPTAAELDAWDD
ncbi:MAG: carbohydrate kinase [Intrasporangiaceae bacterium]|nr:carbohydrate kinase [Intrasporangiaceae bacterium]